MVTRSNCYVVESFCFVLLFFPSPLFELFITWEPSLKQDRQLCPLCSKFLCQCCTWCVGKAALVLQMGCCCDSAQASTVWYDGQTVRKNTVKLSSCPRGWKNLAQLWSSISVAKRLRCAACSTVVWKCTAAQKIQMVSGCALRGVSRPSKGLLKTAFSITRVLIPPESSIIILTVLPLTQELLPLLHFQEWSLTCSASADFWNKN